MKRNWKRGLIATAVLGIVVGAVIAGRALATGIPPTNALTYTGTLEDATGTALTGTHNIEVKLWNVATGGAAALCTTNSQSVTLQGGRFSLSMPDTCTAAVKANPDVWVEVLDNGTSLGRTKSGAVPYAVEADHAVTATTATTASAAGGALAGQVVPAGLIGMFAAACPAGWTICDGIGACPNLIGAYPKGGTTFAAASGMNTHLHAIASSATGPGSSHTHTLTGPGGTGSPTMSFEPAHSHTAQIDYSNAANLLFMHFTAGQPQWNSTHRMNFAFTSDNAASTSTYGVDTTTHPGHAHTLMVSMTPESSHTHAIPAVTVPASNHEPVHATVVFCMKS